MTRALSEKAEAEIFLGFLRQIFADDDLMKTRRSAFSTAACLQTELRGTAGHLSVARLCEVAHASRARVERDLFALMAAGHLTWTQRPGQDVADVVINLRAGELSR